MGRELCARATLHFVPEHDELLDHVRRLQPEVVLCHLNGGGDVGWIGSLASAVPRVSHDTAVVVYCRLVPDVARLWRQAPGATVSAVVLRDHDNLAEALEEVCESRRRRSALRDVVDALEPLAGPAREIWSHCVTRSVDTALTVERLAAELGVSRRTIGNRLRRQRLCPPEALIGWSRVLVAVRLLQHPDASFEAIARQIRFTSGRDCRDMIARYTGHVARVLRRSDGLQTAAAPLVSRWRGDR